MTGFAQGRLDRSDFSLYVSFKSLNHRFLDLNIKGSGVTAGVDKYVRELCKDTVQRGRVDVLVDLFETDPRVWNIQLNEALLRAILDKLMALKATYPDDLSVSLDPLLRLPMVFHVDQKDSEPDDKKMDLIKQTLAKVHRDFLRSRSAEGRSIKEDILVSVRRIEEGVKTLGKEAARIETDLVPRYEEKIRRLLQDRDVDHSRVLQEAAIAAEKSCVTEEINRLRAHGRRLRRLITEKASSKGRELDFISQEMQREVHTISAKAGEMSVNELILQVRREIDKIRQQVQNVE